jgi:hypothetical protein
MDDPNREAVGLAPIWTGADTEPEVDPEPDPEPEVEQTETKRPRRGGKSHEDDTED